MTDGGRTQPLRVTVESSDGEEHDVILKVSAGSECSIEGLANEMLGSLLAADLGLPVVEPFFVALDPDFIESVWSQEVRCRLRDSSPIAFGSRHAGQQWRRWIRGDGVVASQVTVALAVLAFDAFTANSDRSPTNPNLLVHDLEWRLIDHESAFGFRLKLFPRCQPWSVGNLSMIAAGGQPSEHLFFRHLASRKDLELDQVRQSWLGLSDARLAQYDAALPDEWVTVRPILAEALDHLRMVRDKIDDCLVELQRVLT